VHPDGVPEGSPAALQAAGEAGAADPGFHPGLGSGGPSGRGARVQPNREALEFLRVPRSMASTVFVYGIAWSARSLAYLSLLTMTTY
jgi:hypothetical protein